MSRERQAAAILALGAVAAAFGFAGAAWLDGRGEAPPPAAAAARAVPAAPPEEALLEPPPPAEPAAAPGPDPASAPRPLPEAEPAPRPAPRPGPEPRAAPKPRPEPQAPRVPDPRPAPQPPPPPPAHVDPPAEPPAGVVIPAAELPAGAEAARRSLAADLASAPPGSAEEADLRRGLALWNAYLAPAAPPAPAGRRATIARALRANAWWFARRRPPEERVLLRDPDGVILTYRRGQGFAVNPVATTGRWGGLNDDVPPEALAATLLEMGVERVAGDRRFLAWEYYDVADDPAAIRPGASAMAQARVALLMAHGAARSGDPRLEAAALGALGAFVVHVDRGGVRTLVATEAGQAPAPWYVERAYPGESPWKGAALNGFMVTLLNLRGAAAALDREGTASAPAAAALARDLADRGAATLDRHLADHDSGSWSYYGLLTPGRPWRSYLADLNYHCYHVRLLERLAEAYPERGFAATAARWQGYVDRAGVACPARPAAP
ncbi:MAG TPA: D-glucuronyl C5-epimerase family protein [Miltoncostaeaceae bacterium]|nr:D-glucuronyl C5-epimerase family protein [Miltoncostaeaceae bacterium]